MILQKLADSIRAQNWGTVVLEILIVVIGIYFGLQADAWNQSRLDDKRAQQALQDLKVDFVAINDVGNGIAGYYKNIVEDLQILLQNLRAEEINPEDEAAIKRAIANGDNFADPPPPSGTYRDLASSGDLGLIRDTELRLRLIEYDESLAIIMESDAALNDRLAHFTNAFQRHSTLGGTWNVPDTPNLSFIDVTLLGIDQVDYEAMRADPDFRVAAQEHLKTQISRYANIRVTQSKITQIQNLIDKNLGSRAASAEKSD